MSLNVIASVEELFFASKIKATAEQSGATVRFVNSLSKALAQARADKPELIIVDLHSERCEPFALAQAVKSDEALRDITMIGFFSHAQTELMRQAQAAGFDHVLPRSAFTKKLAVLLKERDQ